MCLLLNHERHAISSVTTSTQPSNLQYTAWRWLSLPDIPVQHTEPRWTSSTHQSLKQQWGEKKTVLWKPQRLLFLLSTNPMVTASCVKRLQPDLIQERMSVFLVNPSSVLLEEQACREPWNYLEENWNDNSSNEFRQLNFMDYFLWPQLSGFFCITFSIWSWTQQTIIFYRAVGMWFVKF